MKNIIIKKVTIAFLITFCLFNLCIGCSSLNIDKYSYNDVYNNGIRELRYENVKDSLIRFHVIANSDTDEDQALKLKVRDAVIEYMYPLLKESSSIDESRQILTDNIEKIKNISSEIIRENNHNYDVKVQLSHENFPEKSYGRIVLPQGNYEAFRVIIGSGQGHNWWCVMFPPLCFVDESKAVTEYEKTENKIEGVEKNQKTNDNTKSKENQVVYRFKILELVKELL